MDEQDYDSELNENLGQFAAAFEAIPVSVEKPRLKRILLGLDGTNQDETAIGLATALASREEISLALAYAYTGGADEDKDAYLEATGKAMKAAGTEIFDVIAHDRHPDELSYERLLGHRIDTSADIVICPAPYLEDFRSLGRESTGSNFDVLMGRSPKPLVVVREPKKDPSLCFEHVILPITPFNEATALAASWALRMVKRKGRITLVAPVDVKGIEAIAHILNTEVDIQNMSNEVIAGLNRPKVAGLIAALQKGAAAEDIECNVAVKPGEWIDIVAGFANDREDLLIVTGCPRNPKDSSYIQTQALVRESHDPVMVVTQPVKMTTEPEV